MFHIICTRVKTPVRVLGWLHYFVSILVIPGAPQNPDGHAS
jgi:hypothetical protein